MSSRGEVAPIITSMEQWVSESERLAARKTPTFVHLRAQLPTQGRTNQILAATPLMSVVLKTYAQGGENELHAHTNEDHVFIVLQGGATFHGPNGETREVRANDCVMVPSGALYWFAAADGVEPLVMVRVGAALDVSKDVTARVDETGASLNGFSEANKEVPLILGEKWFG